MRDLLVILEKSPAWIQRAAQAVGEGRGPVGRAADLLRFRYTTTQVPAVPPQSLLPRRLLIGPANSAGQAYQWARAAERADPRLVATSMYGIGTNALRAEVDVEVPVAVYQRSSLWHELFGEFLRSQSHVVWESGLPMLGRSRREGALSEIRELREHGVATALLFHGSDIRPPAEHAKSSHWSPFRSGGGPVRAIEYTVARNLKLAEAAGVEEFVSTPDLLRWRPQATWCPVVVDLRTWSRASDGHLGSPTSAHGRPVVVHVPSNRWLKGTDLVEPMLRHLHDSGVIDYRSASGVTHAQMPELYRSADIVLDQFVLGIYGVAACEAMAAGALVMSHVDDFTRAKVRDVTGLELPIVEATADTLERRLREFAADPGLWADVRGRAVSFVEQVHGGQRSADVLGRFTRSDA